MEDCVQCFVDKVSDRQAQIGDKERERKREKNRHCPLTVNRYWNKNPFTRTTLSLLKITHLALV